MPNRSNMMKRSMKMKLETRSEQDGKKYLEGYFAKFNQPTCLFEGCFEEIDRGAFDNTMDNDIRALGNHKTDFVLGRTKAGTLDLTVDDIGLFGRIHINEDDTDAMNLYHRVQRGDISGNSFGFNVIREDMLELENGDVKFVVKELDLVEVSVVTFPAYDNVTIQARSKEIKDLSTRSIEIKKKELKGRLMK